MQCCGSGMFIPDPGSWFLPIPDPGWTAQEKIWVKFQRIMELFTQKVVTKLSKIWVWDPGSGINLFRIPDRGVKKAPIPDPGSGSATLTVWCEKFVAARHYAVFSKQLLNANDKNRVRWIVLDLLQDGACTDFFENLSEISLKGDLSNATTFNSSLFLLVDTFKIFKLQKD